MRVASLVLWLTVARLAAAAPTETVVVVSPDPVFASAVRETLSSAGLGVAMVTDATNPTLADLTGESRRLADREHATATVTLVFGDDSATLVIYDRGVDRVLLRALPYRPPLTQAQAAEAARMTRSMLRTLRVSPEIDLPPPHAADAAAVRERAATLSMTTPPLPIAADDLLAIDLQGGVRVGSPGADASEDGSIALIWRPDQPGIELAGGIVASSTVAASGFAGTIADMSLALTARIPLRVGRRLVIAGDAGLAVHRVRIDGMVAAPVEVTRFDPALRAGATAIFELRPSVGLGLAVSVDGLLRHQEYSVGAAEVLAVPIAQLTVGVALIARIL